MCNCRNNCTRIFQGVDPEVMVGNVRKYIVLTVLALSQVVHSGGQVLQDTQTIDMIRNGVRCIYNYEFEQASVVSVYLEKKYPNHTVTYLFRGMTMYWQYFPILPGTPEAEQYETCLGKGMEVAEQNLKDNEIVAENLLSALGSIGLLLLYYSDNGMSGKVFSMATKAYQWVMRSFDFTHSYKDFYFFTGLYNYYREAYANAHPIYKPLLVFFPHGSTNIGLRQLKSAADSSIFMKAEAVNFLSGIYMSFENNPARALLYSRKLRDAYPQNPQFKAGYIRDLLVIGKYGEAESLLKSMANSSLNSFHQAQADVFRGIIMEKRYQNLKTAESFYLSGIDKIAPYGTIGNEFSAYGHYGLSRIYQSAGNMKLSRQYRKEARDLSAFDHINFDN